MAFVFSGQAALRAPRRSTFRGRARRQRTPWVARAAPVPFISTDEARKVAQIVEQQVGADVLRDDCAQGVLEVTLECFPRKEYPNAFVLAGHGWTGSVARGVANLLDDAGYHVILFWDPIEEHDETFRPSIVRLDIVPTTGDFYADFYIEGLCGMDADDGLRMIHISPLTKLKEASKPILSIDIPGGWESDTGPSPGARKHNDFLKPEVLVSLGLPKTGASTFAGDFHYLAGYTRLVALQNPTGKFLSEARCFDAEAEKKWWARVPIYPGDKKCVLFRSNPLKPISFSPKAKSGEIYGSPGGFNPTLAPDQKPQRTWVDPDDHDDLWDELD